MRALVDTHEVTVERQGVMMRITDPGAIHLVLRRLEVAFVTHHAIHKWLAGGLKSAPACILRYCEAYNETPEAWRRRYEGAGAEKQLDMLLEVEQSELVERGLWRA